MTERRLELAWLPRASSRPSPITTSPSPRSSPRSTSRSISRRAIDEATEALRRDTAQGGTAAAGHAAEADTAPNSPSFSNSVSFSWTRDAGGGDELFQNVLNLHPEKLTPAVAEAQVVEHLGLLAVLLRVQGIIPWLSLSRIESSPCLSRLPSPITFFMRWLPACVIVALVLLRTARAAGCLEYDPAVELVTRAYTVIFVVILTVYFSTLVFLYHPRRFAAHRLVASEALIRLQFSRAGEPVTDDMELSASEEEILEGQILAFRSHLRVMANRLGAVALGITVVCVVVFNLSRLFSALNDTIADDHEVYSYVCDGDNAQRFGAIPYFVWFVITDTVTFMSGSAGVFMMLWLIGIAAQDVMRLILEFKEMQEELVRIDTKPTNGNVSSAEEEEETTMEVVEEAAEEAMVDPDPGLLNRRRLSREVRAGSVHAVHGVPLWKPDVVAENREELTAREVILDLRMRSLALNEMTKYEATIGVAVLRVCAITLLLSGGVAVLAFFSYIDRDPGRMVVSATPIGFTVLGVGLVIAIISKHLRRQNSLDESFLALAKRALMLVDNADDSDEEPAPPKRFRRASTSGNGTVDTVQVALQDALDSSSSDEEDNARAPVASLPSFTISLAGSSSAFLSGKASVASRVMHDVDAKVFDPWRVQNFMRSFVPVYSKMMLHSVLLTIVIVAFVYASVRLRVPECTRIVMHTPSPFARPHTDACPEWRLMAKEFGNALLATPIALFAPMLFFAVMTSWNTIKDALPVVSVTLVLTVVVRLALGFVDREGTEQLARMPGFLTTVGMMFYTAWKLTQSSPHRRPYSRAFASTYLGTLLYLILIIFISNGAFVSIFVSTADPQRRFFLVLFGYPIIALLLSEILSELCERLNEHSDAGTQAVFLFTSGKFYLSFVERMLLTAVPDFGDQVLAIVIWFCWQIASRSLGPYKQVLVALLTLPPGPQRERRLAAAEHERVSPFARAQLYSETLAQMTSIFTATLVTLVFRDVFRHHLDPEFEAESQSDGGLLVFMALEFALALAGDAISLKCEETFLERDILALWSGTETRHMVSGLLSLIVVFAVALTELTVIVGFVDR